MAGALALGLCVGLSVGLVAACSPRAETPAPSLVGGPFALTDHTGAQVTDQTFLGKPQVIYFGFTYCPDVCPLSLQKLGLAMELLGPAADDIQPILISLDPERDTPEVLATYVASNTFPPRLVGLTGTTDEVAAAASAYRVYYKKTKDAESAADYLIDHTSILYLMDAEGRFVEPFTHDDTPEDIAAGLRRHLQSARR